jgi:hypothetical protein
MMDWPSTTHSSFCGYAHASNALARTEELIRPARKKIFNPTTVLEVMQLFFYAALV